MKIADVANAARNGKLESLGIPKGIPSHWQTLKQFRIYRWENDRPEMSGVRACPIRLQQISLICMLQLVIGLILLIIGFNRLRDYFVRVIINIIFG